MLTSTIRGCMNPIRNPFGSRTIRLRMLFLGFNPAVSSCLAGSLSPVQESFAAAIIAPSVDSSMIYAINSMNSPPGSISLDYLVNYTPSTWTTNINGSSDIYSIGINYNGSLDASSGIATWTGDGSLTTQSIAVSGSAIFADNTAIWSQAGSLGASNWSLSGVISFQQPTDGPASYNADLYGVLNGYNTYMSLQ